jgi:hypothetical protein
MTSSKNSVLPDMTVRNVDVWMIGGFVVMGKFFLFSMREGAFGALRATLADVREARQNSLSTRKLTCYILLPHLNVGRPLSLTLSLSHPSSSVTV